MSSSNLRYNFDSKDPYNYTLKEKNNVISVKSEVGDFTGNGEKQQTKKVLKPPFLICTVPCLDDNFLIDHFSN